MIYITGDTHADFHRFNKENFPEQESMTKDDFVIILGDFGGIWYPKETKQEKYWLDWLNNKSFTLLFVDGNHENFDRIYSYPVTQMFGGDIHIIRPNIIHLMRGQIYEICGKTFFTFGGARSHDIQDGILELNETDKIKEYNKLGKMFRVNHLSWWEQEMPSDKEMAIGMENLKNHGFNVDFILSHDMPTSTLTLYATCFRGFAPHPDRLNNYFDDIRAKTNYKHWFCGHYHDERNVTQQEHILYEQITRIV